jgi:hypothetical protein
MTRLLRHTVTSVAVGLLLAGLLSAVLMATIPRSWRGPAVVAIAVAATIAGVMVARGIRPPEP